MDNNYNKSGGGYNNGGYDNGNYNNGYNNGGYNNMQNPDDSKADIILILGILSLVCCAPCGIAAIVMRCMYKDKISEAKQSSVTAGFVTGIIGVSLWALGILLYLCIFLIALLA